MDTEDVRGLIYGFWPLKITEQLQGYGILADTQYSNCLEYFTETKWNPDNPFLIVLVIRDITACNAGSYG